MTGGETTRAACMDSAITGLYADMLPPMQPTLRQLAERVLLADMVRDTATDAEFDRVEADYDDARDAFVGELIAQTGIPAMLWQRMGDHMP